MNTVFQLYISYMGKRYVSSVPSKIQPLTCCLADKTYNFVVTEFEYDGKILRFMETGNVGFLSQEVFDIPSTVLPAHKDLISEIGVVSDLFGFSDVYMQNITDVFLYATSTESMKELQENLKAKCDENQLEIAFSSPISLSNLTIFAYEANGNVFLYNADGEVFLYASDHCYTNLIPVSGYPEFTLYHIKNIQIFNDFIEIFCNNLSL